MRTSKDRIDERLEVQGDVWIGRCQWNTNGRQRANKMGRPVRATRRLLFAAHEQVKRAVRPAPRHGHAAAAAEQVECHEVCQTAKVDLTFAVVCRMRSLPEEFDKL